MPAINDYDELPQLMYAGEMLKPLRTDYGLSTPYGAITTDIDGGMPLISRNTINNAQTVTVTYNLNDADMVDWFDKWYRVFAMEGSMPVRLMLTLGEAEPQEYACIIRSPIAYSEFTGFNALITFTVTAQKIIEDYPYEESLLWLIQIYGVRGVIEILEYLELYSNVWSTESLAEWGYAR